MIVRLLRANGSEEATYECRSVCKQAFEDRVEVIVSPGPLLTLHVGDRLFQMNNEGKNIGVINGPEEVKDAEPAPQAAAGG